MFVSQPFRRRELRIAHAESFKVSTREVSSQLLSILERKAAAAERATLFRNKTKSDSGVIPRSAFTRGHLPREHFDGPDVLPSFLLGVRPTNTDFCELQHLSNGGQTERVERRGALVMCRMDGKPPLSQTLCRSTKSGRITYFQQLASTSAAELSSFAAAVAAACTSTLEADNHSQFATAAAPPRSRP